MINLTKITTVAIVLIYASALHGQEKELRGKFYQNPVYGHNFPDPTVIKGHDGFFYAYATQTLQDSNRINIQIAKSDDLVDWTWVGDALPEPPDWADSDFWAPHVLYDSVYQTYYLYYSGESNKEEGGKCLGVATSKSPAGPFIDKGEPLICGDSFVNIDPMAFDDPRSGKKLLYWGSAFLPIKVQELADNRLQFKENSRPTDLVFPGQDSTYNILIEGAWMHYRDDYYYLFYSGDNCCGEKANYAVMVARSDDAMGPFTRLGEIRADGSSAILEKNAAFNAPGHNSVIRDDNGDDWIFYHAIPQTGDTEIGRIMLIDKLSYRDGWPLLIEGGPSIDSVRTPEIRLD